MQTQDEFLKRVKRKKPHKCNSRMCTNDRPKSRTYCWKCLKRWWRYRNVRKDLYNNLKQNAKRRGIAFTIGLDEFLLICDLTGYTEDGHLSFGDRLSFDRIDNNRGYSIDNLRVISVRDNSRRSTKPVIIIKGVEISHTEYTFDEDPLQSVRDAAVQEMIKTWMVEHGQSGYPDNDEDLPSWLAVTKVEIDEPF